jgi:tellurite resistance protein TerC
MSDLDRVVWRRSLAWSLGWIAAACAFGGVVTWHLGAASGEEFFAAYLLEKSLSVDNLFVFVAVFGALAIPPAQQRRVLMWGILGAVVARGAFIAAGAAVLARWHEVTYVFGALLIVTAAKMLRPPKPRDEVPHLAWLRRRLRLPPWLLALVAIELADLVFAVDSVPAAFSVTDDPLIVYSSNIFAMLGLRSLYTVLATALVRLRHLHLGLSAVLAFAGAKMLAAPWVHVAPLASVAVVAGCLAAAVAASLAVKR